LQHPNKNSMKKSKQDLLFETTLRTLKNVKAACSWCDQGTLLILCGVVWKMIR